MSSIDNTENPKRIFWVPGNWNNKLEPPTGSSLRTVVGGSPISDVKKEALYAAFAAVTTFAILFILYFTNPLLTTIRLTLSYLYFFTLPGVLILTLFFDLDAFTRYIIGTILGMAVYGILTYYILVIFPVNIHDFYFYVPLLLVFLILGIKRISVSFETKD